MPELGPYGSVRGALSIRPPKHAASDNHRRSTTRRSSLSSNETPGVSAKRRASAARRWHFSIKWLLCSTVTSVPFFAGSMISCQQQLAAALRASRTRRKDVEFDAHATLPVQFYFLVRRSSSPRKGVSFRRCGQHSRHDRDERHGDAEKIDRGGKEHEHGCIHAIGPDRVSEAEAEGPRGR
jgi:hypothetical protein